MYKICHTEESSRRQRELETGLLEAMKTLPYEKITLTELCRQLNIPRKSFYRYFPTKEDCLLALIDHTLADCNDMALKGWNGSGNLDEHMYLRFFRFWREHRGFLDAVRENGLGYLLLERTTVIVDRMKETAEPTSFARDQVEYFIAYGLMTTVLRWHHYGFQSSPEEMAKEIGGLLGNSDVSVSRLLL
ncbi:MAG: TetR/AcrR family transcriptional regulator [Oscillospiraceae bacterium]|nr:TetR/AcrR family transcriptional regulator [Oscillospiraceae bacterium]